MSTQVHTSWLREGTGTLLADAWRAWLWEDQMTGEQLAVKVLSVFDDTKFASTAKREFNAIRALPPHRNLVTPSITIDARKCQIVTPHMPDGNLHKFISGRVSEEKPLSELEIARITIQLCNALFVLHNERRVSRRLCIVHCDLRPGNILVDRGRFVFKVSGFGLSKTSEASTKSQTSASIDAYKAPEQFDPEKTACPSTDVYGLGATMWHMATGSVPWLDTKDQPRDYRRTLLCRAKEHRHDLSDEMDDLIKWCTESTPSERPSLHEIVEKCQAVVLKHTASGQGPRIYLDDEFPAVNREDNDAAAA